MATTLGNILISNVAVGSSAATALALGNVAVWQGGGEPPVPQVDAVCFTALEDSSSIRLNKTSGSPAISIEYSTDGETWSDYTWSGNTGTLVNLAAAGDKAYFRAKNDNAKLATKDAYNYSNFVATGKLAASGNMMTLLKGDGTLSDLTDSNSTAFACLFDSCTALYDASELKLPSKYVPYAGYANMFYGCSNLSAGPDIPALSADNNAYAWMFGGAGLVDAPKLSTTTFLSTFVCANMFSDCTSLTAAPELPATTLTRGCYKGMLSGCTALTTVPELPATTLAIECYQNMFQVCTSLTAAPILPATTLANYCYSSMFYGCTSLTAAPILPATTLANYCYSSMFYGCSSLTTARTLSATTLADYCYATMFYNCSSLSSVEVAFTNWTGAYNPTTNWLNGVAASGTFTCPAALGDDSTITRGVNNCPTDWTVINT